MKNAGDKPIDFIKPADLPEMPELKEIELPSLSRSFKDVYYSAGSLPLFLVISTAAILAFLIFKQIIIFASYLTYIFTILGATAIILILIMNSIAYKKWRLESKLAIENHRAEMERYQLSYQWEKEQQDRFILNVLEFFHTLSKGQSNSIENQDYYIKSLTKFAGDLVVRMIKLRKQILLSEISKAEPELARKKKK